MLYLYVPYKCYLHTVQVHTKIKYIVDNTNHEQDEVLIDVNEALFRIKLRLILQTETDSGSFFSPCSSLITTTTTTINMIKTLWWGLRLQNPPLMTQPWWPTSPQVSKAKWLIGLSSMTINVNHQIRWFFFHLLFFINNT